MWDLSCKDWSARIRQGRSLMPALPLVTSEAEEALGFFNELRLPDQPGTPRLGDAAGDWFKEIVAAAFGSYDPIAKQRFIKEIFVLAPKGSSKTTYAAGLGLTALLMNTRKRVEMLIVADTQAISERTYEVIAGMIEEDPQLSRFKAHMVSGTGVIDDLVTGASLKIKTFDVNILTGSKPVLVLLDELHLLGKRSGASKVMVQIRNGLAKNPEGLLVTLTTQSDSRPAGVFLNDLERARAIRDGKITGQTLPILYEFPEDIATNPTKWQDPDNWWMVLPNFGKSQRLPDLFETFRKAQFDGEHAMREWASQQLNIQISVGLRENVWAGAEYWPRGALAGGLTLDDLIERCEVITFGADGGGLDDLFGVAAVGRERDTGRWLLWTHAFISPEGQERRKANAELYAGFIQDGDLTVVTELPQDVDEIVALVAQVKDAGLLAGVGVDRWSLGGLVDGLAEIDVTEENGLLGGVAQGAALAPTLKTVERKLVDGTFKHGDQPMMAWCAGNAIIHPTPAGMRVARDASGYGKIDPLVAALNGAALMTKNPVASSAGRLGDFLANPLAA
jgi:phage terminase large subunit-like protein